jgi:hypothetical protein
MKIIVYGTHEIVPAVVGALKMARHEVTHLTHKFFEVDSPPQCDAAIAVECPNSLEIVQAYMAAGIPSYTLDTKETVVPGYPVAAFLPWAVGDFHLWGFLNHKTPDVYRNPQAGELICAFYPGGPLVLERRPAPSHQWLAEVFHEKSLAEAPRVWVVGGGHSLKDFDWSLLEGEVVIGANRAFEQPNVGICITIDPLFERLSFNGDLGHESREKWREFKGLKVYAACETGPPRSDDVILAPRKTNKQDDCLPPTVHNLGKASNSGFAAVKLAWALGAKQIYCLGLDMGGVEGRQAWFHDGYPDVYADSCYEEFRREMDAAAPYLAADGVSVTVCGPSALTAFPTITLDAAAELLSLKPARPVVCGFYTRGTRYKQEAEAMARTAVAFGFDVDLVDVENLGDWKLNTDQKPEAIRFALDAQLPGRSIAFVDADARFRAYPRLFDVFAAGDSELGLSFFDWDRFPLDPRAGRELSTAVMLLKQTKGVMRLLDKWIEYVKEGRNEWEQRVLQSLLSDYSGPTLKTMEIPMRYNQIFDDMSQLGLPVISQMQASRRLKSEVAA